jgi:hypothetical protein
MEDFFTIRLGEINFLLLLIRLDSFQILYKETNEGIIRSAIKVRKKEQSGNKHEYATDLICIGRNKKKKKKGKICYGSKHTISMP